MRTLILYLLLLFIFGCVPKSDRNESIDRNLKSNAQVFMDSKLNYDFKKVTIYAHPVYWKIVKLRFPDEKDLSVIKQILEKKYISSGIKQMNADLNMKVNIGNIIDSISVSDKEFIYLLEYEQTGENKYDKVYRKSIIVAVTKDKGSRWKFIDIDRDYLAQTKEFLTAIYPVEIVDYIYRTIDKGVKVSTIETAFSPVDNKEINLQNQFNAYWDAIKNKNINKAVNYIYPGIFEYFYDHFQGKYSLNNIKTKYVEELNKQFPKENKLEMRVSKILNKVVYKNSLIYAVSYFIQSGNQYDYALAGGEMFAISDDNGTKWGFFENTQESYKPILSKKFPDQVITKILNYEYQK